MTRDEYKASLGEAIQRKRKEHGWTLDDIIPLLGDAMSRSSLSAIEHGRQDLNIYEFFLLEKIMGELPRPEIKFTIS